MSVSNSNITPNMGSQQAPVTQGYNSINDKLPVEMICKILTNMPPSEDFKNAQVCQLWKNVVKDLPDPSLQIIGDQIWREYLGFEIEGHVPPLPKGIHKTVRSDRRCLAGKKEAPTCSAILMPKGLTANKLIELMENPKKGHSTELDYISDSVVAELGDKAVEKSYWLVMTNDVIEGSRQKSYKSQKNLVKEKTNSKCELPTYLEALAACVMHHVIYGEHLLGRENATYTRCQDLVKGYGYTSPVVVGGSGGLDVHRNDFDSDYLGATAKTACNRKKKLAFFRKP